jgi:lambda repressor-like predicted transcriptional regulator
MTNTSHFEENQQSELRVVEFPEAEKIIKQPTALEVSVLTFWKLRYARSHEQELNNDFAHLLNRGSSLE